MIYSLQFPWLKETLLEYQHHRWELVLCRIEQIKILQPVHCYNDRSTSFAKHENKTTYCRALTFKKSSIDSCDASIPNLIDCKYFELKQVTWAMVGCSKVELWFIYTAVGGEWSPPSGNVVDFHTVPEVRVHSGDVQGKGRGPDKEDG